MKNQPPPVAYDKLECFLFNARFGNFERVVGTLLVSLLPSSNLVVLASHIDLAFDVGVLVLFFVFVFREESAVFFIHIIDLVCVILQ
jgi:hypothetical protein